MILNLLMYIVSLVPIFLILFLIYYFDDIEREPLWLLITLFFGGVLSIILIKILGNVFTIFDPETFFGDGTGFNGFLQYFTSVGIIEEISKFVIMYIVIWKNKNFNYIFDAIVYGVFVSMGFAAVENFTYIFLNGTLGTLLLRSLLTIPAHASFGVLMGYFMGNARYYKEDQEFSRSKLHKYCSFFVPMLLHGTYDYLLNLGELKGQLFVYIYFGYVLVLFIFALLKIVEFYKLKLEFNKPTYERNEEAVYYSNVAHLDDVKNNKEESVNTNNVLFNFNNIKPVTNNISDININNDFNQVNVLNNIPIIDNNNQVNISNNESGISSGNQANNINNKVDLLKVNNQVSETDKINNNVSNNTINNQVNSDMDVLFNPQINNNTISNNNNNDNFNNRLF